MIPYDADSYMLKASRMVTTSQGRLIDRIADIAKELFIQDELMKISFLMRELRNSPDISLPDDVDEGEL